MKLTKFLIVFFILILVFALRYMDGFANAKLFVASLISPVNLQDEFEEKIPDQLVYQEPEEQNLQQEVAIQVEQPIIAEPVIESTQDKIDDILEKIDILQQQLLEMSEVAEADDEQDELKEEPKKEPDDQLAVKVVESEQNLPMPNVVVAAVVRSSGGGPSYPKIVISEVQIEGLGDSKEEFVELYNPNASDVDLTSWYLQRKTGGGSSYATFAPNALFSGKKITSKGYFLIAREGFLSGLADIFVEHPLTEDNSLILKNPNGETSDKVGWGAAQDFEAFPAINPMPGYSIGRNGDEQDTNMNSVDFTATNPTPMAQNFPYVPPVEIPIELADGIAPEVTFNINAIQKELSFGIDFILTDPVGAVSPSGISVFSFRWRGEDSEWQESESENVAGSPASFVSTREFAGLDEKNYYFQIKVKDVEGNESEWLPEVPVATKISLFKKILINEIQTAGVTVKDEFITLYNPNAVGMNLAGFALKKKTSTGTESNLVSDNSFSGTILAGGYFLIAPQDEDGGQKNYLGSVEPDLRYSGKSFSIADNNTVLLYSAEDELLDKVGFGEAQDFEMAGTVNPPASNSIIRLAQQDTDSNAQDFQVKDAVPPIDEPPADSPADPLAPQIVVINEIAWMGTEASTNDEWIELFNPGEDAVALSGWLLKTDELLPIPSISLSGSIAAHAFYLLERTSDDTVPGTVADYIYTGALSNSGEDLSLIDSSQNVIDQVNSIPWFAGDNDTKQTMQRKDPLISGNTADNWQTSQDVGGSPRS